MCDTGRASKLCISSQCAKYLHFDCHFSSLHTNHVQCVVSLSLSMSMEKPYASHPSSHSLRIESAHQRNDVGVFLRRRPSSTSPTLTPHSFPTVCSSFSIQFAESNDNNSNKKTTISSHCHLALAISPTFLTPRDLKWTKQITGCQQNATAKWKTRTSAQVVVAASTSQQQKKRRKKCEMATRRRIMANDA